MDYSKLTNEQRRACLSLVGTLIGKAATMQETNEFEGLARLAYLAAWQELANLLTVEYELIARSYPPVT